MSVCISLIQGIEASNWLQFLTLMKETKKSKYQLTKKYQRFNVYIEEFEVLN